jgi:hypothetical protein
VELQAAAKSPAAVFFFSRLRYFAVMQVRTNSEFAIFTHNRENRMEPYK